MRTTRCNSYDLLPASEPVHQVLKTICSNIGSSASEDGHNDARNTLS